MSTLIKPGHLAQSNGEKTSPAPLEDVLRQSPLVTDALVFGSNRSSIGALIVPASSFASPSVEALRSTLAAVNAIAPRHSQLSPELVVFLPPSAVVPRASKGSLQRGRAYDVFAAEIEQAYLRFDGTAPEGSGSKLTLEGEDLVRFIEGVVGEAVGEMAKGVGRDDDLFALGVNSLQAVRIRNALQKVKLLSNDLAQLGRLMRSPPAPGSQGREAAVQRRLRELDHDRVRPQRLEHSRQSRLTLLIW